MATWIYRIVLMLVFAYAGHGHAQAETEPSNRNSPDATQLELDASDIDFADLLAKRPRSDDALQEQSFGALVGGSSRVEVSSRLGYSEYPEGEDPLAPVVTPTLERRQIKRARLDTENWELGTFAGAMNIEDFGTNLVYGVKATYHVTESLFAEASFGQTEAGETSFETLSGAAQILTDDQRQLTYYLIGAGVNLFQGEFFIGSKRALHGNLFISAAAGNTDFAGNNYFTYAAGFGGRAFVTDWLSINAMFRVHSFEHELLGEPVRVFNLEPSAGLTIFF